MPVLSVLAMLFTMLLTVLLPLGLMCLYRRRGARWSQFAAGAVTVVVSAFVLEQVFRTLVLGVLGTGFAERVVPYVLFLSLTAGVFEETGRLFTFQTFLKKYDSPAAALAYGAGHGGAEAVLLVGTTMVNNLVLMALLALGGELPAELSGIGPALLTTPASAYLWSALERTTAIAFHICNSVLVFSAARRRERRWLYPAAILTHTALNLISVLTARYVGVAASELASLGFTALTACWAAAEYKGLEKISREP